MPATAFNSGLRSSTTGRGGRELAHRTSDGIEVSLFWSTRSNQVTVAVLDTRSGEALEFEVDGSVALEAFNHPYAYAATQRGSGVALLGGVVAR